VAGSEGLRLPQSALICASDKVGVNQNIYIFTSIGMAPDLPFGLLDWRFSILDQRI
jgi:hypothetical protein